MCTTLKTRGKLSHMLKQGKPKTVNPSKRGFVINVKSRENRGATTEPFTSSPTGYTEYTRVSPTGNSKGGETDLRSQEPYLFHAAMGRFEGKRRSMLEEPHWQIYHHAGWPRRRMKGLFPTGRDMEGRGRNVKKEKRRRREKGRASPAEGLLEIPSLLPFEFLKRRRHRCLLDNSVRHARMTGRRQTRRDGSTSERCILEYAHVQVVLLVHIRLIDGASKSRVQPRATRVGDSSKRNLVSF